MLVKWCSFPSSFPAKQKHYYSFFISFYFNVSFNNRPLFHFPEKEKNDFRINSFLMVTALGPLPSSLVIVFLFNIFLFYYYIHSFHLPFPLFFTFNNLLLITMSRTIVILQKRWQEISWSSRVKNAMFSQNITTDADENKKIIAKKLKI